MNNTYWAINTNRGLCAVRAPDVQAAEAILRKWHGLSLEFTGRAPVLLKKRPDPDVGIPVWSEQGQEDTYFADGRPALIGGADFIRLATLGSGATPEEAYRRGVHWAVKHGG